MPKGRGARCYGYVGSDPQYVHCTREEYAGGLRETAAGTYAHFLGDCRCGKSHGGAGTRSGARRDARKPQTLRRFEIRDAQGVLQGVHVRRDGADGKTMWWESPDGSKGLGGAKVEELPLYGAERLTQLPDGNRVVLVEGEVAAEALWTRGVAAVGTVTGAAAPPSDGALEPLRRLCPVLWPDNDDPGRRHMLGIAARLAAAGAPVKTVLWADAPPKGDAADFEGPDEELLALVAGAACWVPPSPADGLGKLLDEVEAFIQAYTVLGAAELCAATLWVAHTWAFDAAEMTPYLAITSAEKQSGKTQLLATLDVLVCRPWLTARTTTAALVRKIEKNRPTLLLDESDAAFAVKEYSEVLRGILNAGYRRGGATSICVGKSADIEVRDFNVFCPKAIAGIRDLPDTVADRSIPITMKRKLVTEKTERFREREVRAAAVPLRKRLEEWSAIAILVLAAATPGQVVGLPDRAQDVWEPLIAIADLAGGDWPRRARESAQELSGRTVREDGSEGVKLLKDIRSTFRDAAVDRLRSADLAGGLGRIEESLWGDYRGRPLHTTALARLLKPYGIAPHQVRFGDKTFKGYTEGDFADAWPRYLPPEGETPETGETKSSRE